MRIIWDVRSHRLYPIGTDGFTSGTVNMVRHISKGLADRGHIVHVVTSDLNREEQRGQTLWYWSPRAFPIDADVVVMLMNIEVPTPFEADKLVLATYGIDPNLGPEHQWADGVDAFPVLSETHKRLMMRNRPTIVPEKCFVTGLGVSLKDYPLNSSAYKVPGRMLFANDPTRGLLYLLDIFNVVKREVPEATLHIAYDFDRNLESIKWEHQYMAQMLLDCKRQIDTTPGIVNCGKLTHDEIVHEQLECQVHCMPSDPTNHDQIHGLTQLECAAAGAAFVLSDIDSFPELFGDVASILPVVGTYIPERERRVTAEDYARVVIRLMEDREYWNMASQKSRVLAEQHTWDKVVDRWEAMLASITEGIAVG